MEIYAREFAPALGRAAPEAEITAYINREAASSGFTLGPAARLVTVPVPARNRLAWVAGEQMLLPRLAGRDHIEILHSLASTAPATGSFARVTTIHDLIYRRFPEAHFGMRTLGMRVVVPLAARRSHRIIAVSRSTADDIESLLGIGPEKVDVIHQGHGDPPVAGIHPQAEDQVRRRWGLGDRPLVLTLSAKRPVKNLMRLVEALALIPQERRPVLAMPGYPTPYEEELRLRIGQLGLEPDVRMPGWIRDTELEGLWGAASCFVFPSLYEGFGAPILEAMRRGVPVASSNRASLPEVAGDAALFFDPENPTAIAEAIEIILRDAKRARELVSLGSTRAARFTWERTAQLTLASYEKALAAASGRRMAAS